MSDSPPLPFPLRILYHKMETVVKNIWGRAVRDAGTDFVIAENMHNTIFCIFCLILPRWILYFV